MMGTPIYTNKKIFYIIEMASSYSRETSRGGSRAAATSKMERWKPLTIITKRSILDVAAALDPPLEFS